MSKKLTTLAVFGVLVILGLLTDKRPESTTTKAAPATRTEPVTQIKTTPTEAEKPPVGENFETVRSKLLAEADKHTVRADYEAERSELRAKEELMHPERNMKIAKMSWEKGGFDAIMLANLTIRNDNETAVKDMAIECHTYGPSGTQLSTPSKTLYEVIPAHSTKRFWRINMGFMNQQSSNADCSLEGAVRMAAE